MTAKLRVLLVRKGDELDFVPRHLAEMTGFPVRFGLLDALLAGRNEIPPDMARPIHRRAAEDDEMGVGRGGNRHGVARLEDQKAAGLEFVAGDIEYTVDHIDRALFMVGIERQL